MENFYIGQDVVAICNHPQGHFKDGDVFTTKGLKQGCCSGILLDIGKKSRNWNMCPSCHYEDEDQISWFSSFRFKPLDSLVNIDELTEVLNEPIFGAMIKKGN